MNIYAGDDEQTRACPTCGQQVPLQSTVCGYCGHDFSGQFVGVPQMASRSSGFSGLRGLVVTVLVLSIIGTTAFVFFVGSKVNSVVDEAFDSVPDINEEINEAIIGGGKTPISGKGSYKTARALVADLNENGLECGQFDLVTENDALQTATCFSGTDPLTIQVMYDQLSYDAIVDGYKKQKDLDVAYGTNWTVITTTRQLAKQVARVLGGKTN